MRYHFVQLEQCSSSCMYIFNGSGSKAGKNPLSLYFVIQVAQ